MYNRKDNGKVYLCPIDGRKSFYGKAYVQREGRALCLYSYDTKVCSCINGRIVKHWPDYSATTMRHINSFVKHCGIDGGGKKWWTELPYVKA